MAQIGEKYYDTLAAAVNAAADGDKVTLLKDLDLGNDRITIKKAITLDLNGCKITGTNATNTLWFEAEGITLQDSRGNGKVQNTGTGSNNIAIVVNGATTTAYLKDGIVSGNYAVFVQNGAKAVIDGGKYTGTYGACTVGTNESASKTTLEVNITGGTLTSDNNAAIAIYRLAKVDGQWTTNDNAALKNYRTSLNIKGGHFSGDNRKGAFEVDSVAKDVIHISSGYFPSDPSAYVADGKAALPGTEPGYAFTVGDKVTTDVVVKPAAGDPVVDDSKLPSMSDEDKTAITNVAASVKDDGVLVAAANSVVNTVTQEEKEDAEAALKAPGSGVEVQGDVTTYVQAYLDIKPTAYDDTNKTFTLDITPMYRVVASTAEQADKIVVVGEAEQGETANAVVLEGSEKKLTNLQTMTISITLPGSWSVTNNQVYVQHKGHEYVATVAGNVATFTNPHGFSAFVVSTTPAAVAEVNGDRYMDLTDALNAAENGNTVTILKAPDANTNFSMSGDTRTIKVKNGTESNLTVTINGEKHENVKANESFEVKYTRPSSGGGSSSTTYAVNVEKAKHGSVDSNRSRASSGTTVTLTVQPDNGYELDELTVTDKNGNELKLTKKSDTKYTFTMPKSAVTVEATFAEESKDTGYSDVSADAWYADAVQYVSDKGMMQGNNGKFMPADKLNRGQMAQVIFNLEGHQTVNYAMSFGDVKGSEWFAEAVRWAASEKIVSGYDNGNFGPNDPITREQLAVILFRYAQYKGMDTVTLEENLTGFADADEISGYAVSALYWAVGAGVINGTGAGLAPKANATRSEVAQMLMNFDQNVVK